MVIRLKEMISRPTLQSLYIEMCFDGVNTACGTAFVYAAGDMQFLITNRHNFTALNQETGAPLSPMQPKPNQVRIFHNRAERILDPVESIQQILDENDRPLWKEHPTLGTAFDCVALPLTPPPEAFVLPLNEYEAVPKLRIGPSETVSVIGYPFGNRKARTSAVWATGFVASEPSIDYDDKPVFLIDCRARQGQSGSPVFAYRSAGMNAFENGSIQALMTPVVNFLGIYSGRINDQSDLGMVWKAHAIQELVLHAALN